MFSHIPWYKWQSFHLVKDARIDYKLILYDLIQSALQVKFWQLLCPNQVQIIINMQTLRQQMIENLIYECFIKGDVFQAKP